MSQHSITATAIAALLSDNDELPDQNTTYPFDSSTPNWCPTQEYNHLFIRGVETHLNDVLNHRGHVLLNEVFDALGFPRSPFGAVCGWISNLELETAIVFDAVETDNGAILIKFNHEGVIVDLI